MTQMAQQMEWASESIKAMGKPADMHICGEGLLRA